MAWRILRYGLREDGLAHSALRLAGRRPGAFCAMACGKTAWRILRYGLREDGLAHSLPRLADCNRGTAS